MSSLIYNIEDSLKAVLRRFRLYVHPIYVPVSLCSLYSTCVSMRCDVKVTFRNSSLLSRHIQVMVAEALDISRETYFAILMDRACNGPVMVGSPQGGVDIEEVAASSPELIFKVYNFYHCNI